MKRLRLLVGVVVLGALAATAGCVAAADRAESEQPAEAREARVESHWQGPVAVVIETTRAKGQLTPQQRARVDVIAQELEQERSSRKATKQKLRASAADIVRAGHASPWETRLAIGEALSAVEAHMRAGSSALIELHGILGAEQRALVASALEQRLEERKARHAAHHRHHPRWRKLFRRLGLTPTQKAELERTRKELKAERKRIKPHFQEIAALIDAFRTPEFPRELEAYQARKLELMRERLETGSRHADTVLTLLFPDQRELLADLIQFGPEALGLDGDRR